jgi:hypothetical protein
MDVPHFPKKEKRTWRHMALFVKAVRCQWTDQNCLEQTPMGQEMKSIAPNCFQNGKFTQPDITTRENDQQMYRSYGTEEHHA